MKSLGYHHSVYQLNNNIDRGIRCILYVNGVFGILTSHSTYQVNPREFQVITEDEYGSFYTLMPTPRMLYSSIGVSHQFKWKYGERGDVAILTSEPGLRFFNGNTFDRNLAVGAILESELKQFDNTMILSFNNTEGIDIWGKK